MHKLSVLAGLLAILLCRNTLAIDLKAVSSSPEWLALLHYQEEGLLWSSWESEADDERFFLSEGGKYSPLKELQATYQKQFIESDVDSICRFPARYALLAKLKKQPSKNGLLQCTEFQKWQKKLAVHRATLIFPAAYLDSPSSMFGHTLLRLDKDPKEDSTGLLSHTYSFAATMPESGSELAFVYRGLVGGYPGETTTPPYYLKLKEYRDIESRDIWEYSLNLDDEQIEQLMRHIWEIKDIGFDYFFFGENYSYRVMALLNAIIPNKTLHQPNRLYTIPVVTVRDALESGLVNGWRFRPSVKTQLNHVFEQLSSNEKAWVEIYVQGSLSKLKAALENNSPTNNTLEVAYQYSRMLPKSDTEAKAKSFALLGAKSKTDKATLTEVPTPVRRDDEGHESERLTLAWGRTRNKAFVDLEIRPAYHELIDPGQGYPLGSELVFGKTAFRYSQNNLKLQNIDVISIKSLKTVSRLFSPVSWAVRIGLDRQNVSSSNRLAPKLSGSLGKTYSPLTGVLGYGLVGGEALYQSRLEKNMDILAVATIGLLWQQGAFRALTTFEIKDSSIYGTNQHRKLRSELSYQLSEDFDTSVYFEKENLPGEDSSFALTLRAFF